MRLLESQGRHILKPSRVRRGGKRARPQWNQTRSARKLGRRLGCYHVGTSGVRAASVCTGGRKLGQACSVPIIGPKCFLRSHWHRNFAPVVNTACLQWARLGTSRRLHMLRNREGEIVPMTRTMQRTAADDGTCSEGSTNRLPRNDSNARILREEGLYA